jgi:hypothetical protein
MYPTLPLHREREVGTSRYGTIPLGIVPFTTSLEWYGIVPYKLQIKYGTISTTYNIITH